MSKKTISWLLFISLIINFSVLATFSYYRWQHNSKNTTRSRRSDFRSRMKKRLNLSDDQEKRINDLRSHFFENIHPIRDRIHAQRRELMQMISSDTVDTIFIMQKLDSLKELEKQIDVQSVKNLLRYREVLSPEQQKKFMKMISGRMHGDSKERKSRNSKEKTMDCPEDSINNSKNR